MRPSKRETLLDTAERLFYREGFHATGVDRLASEAGIARMTLYNHFASKEALVEAVLERRYARYMKDLRAAVRGHEGRGAVRTLAEQHCNWLREHAAHGCIVIKAIGEFEQHNADIAALGQRLKRGLLQLIEEAVEIDHGEPCPAIAEQVLMILEGANALSPVLGPERAIEQVNSLVARLRLPEDAVTA